MHFTLCPCWQEAGVEEAEFYKTRKQKPLLVLLALSSHSLSAQFPKTDVSASCFNLPSDS